MCYNFRMKRMLLSIALLLLPAVAYAAPSMKFETLTHDFGKVREGDALEFTFTFGNAGTDDLIIEKIHAS